MEYLIHKPAAPMKSCNILFVILVVLSTASFVNAAEDLKQAYEIALRNGSMDNLKQAIKDGADPFLSISGNSAVSYGATRNCDLMRYLIDRKIDLSRRFLAGKTALMLASSEGEDFCSFCLLADSTADINQTGVDGFRALDHALTARNYNKAKYLLKKGADPNLSTGQGMVPLMYRRVLAKAFEDLLLEYKANELNDDLKTKIIQTIAEIRVLNWVVYREAAETGIMNSDSATFERVKPYLNSTGESIVTLSGGLDLFGNPYIFKTVGESVKINQHSVNEIVSQMGSLPKEWEGLTEE